MQLISWYRWWDSNPHGVATNGFWVRHVYQFHHTGIFDQVPINYITKMGWAQEKNFALFLRKKKNLQKAPWQVKGFHGKVKCFYILIKRARSPMLHGNYNIGPGSWQEESWKRFKLIRVFAKGAVWRFCAQRRGNAEESRERTEKQ